MLVVETIAKIRLDHLVRGVPIKKIARDLRVSKNTVRKVVRGDETSFSYERKIQPMPKLGPWVEELERQLEANEKKQRRDRLSLLRIHEDLASLGYEGGYDAVRRYARAWRRRWRLLSPSQAFVPLSFDPGKAPHSIFPATTVSPPSALHTAQRCIRPAGGRGRRWTVETREPEKGLLDREQAFLDQPVDHGGHHVAHSLRGGTGHLDPAFREFPIPLVHFSLPRSGFHRPVRRRGLADIPRGDASGIAGV